MKTDEFALYDGAYVLGALSPTDRREYEDHLRGCADCASSIAELAGLPGLMSRVSPEELTTAVEAPPETLLPSLARAVRRERGRRRLAAGLAAATAASLIVVGAVAVIGRDSPARQPLAPAASTSPSPTASTGTANLALSAVVPSPVTASARLVDVAWGTRIELTCSYSASYSAQGYDPAGGSAYALVVVDRNGAAQQIATWRALPDRELTVHGASALARGDIAAVEVRTLSGRAILRLST